MFYKNSFAKKKKNQSPNKTKMNILLFLILIEFCWSWNVDGNPIQATKQIEQVFFTKFEEIIKLLVKKKSLTKKLTFL